MKKTKLRALRYLLTDDVIRTTKTCLEQNNLSMTTKDIKMVVRHFLNVAKAALAYGNAVKLVHIGTIYPIIHEIYKNLYVKDGEKFVRYAFRASHTLKKQAKENNCLTRVMERYKEEKV